MNPLEPNPGLDRVRHALRAGGVKPGDVSPLRSGVHSRGYLPHVKREGAAYFVTFRLADSLPAEALLKFAARRAERLRQLVTGPGSPVGGDAESMERDHRREIERLLDRGLGACWLRRPEIADLVAHALRFFDGERHVLKAWVVMPNHVHAVVLPLGNNTLSEILQSWKRYTARAANERLGRTGQPFWQRESFDHWIRNDEEHARCCGYTIRNPVAAGLCAAPEQWRWSSAWRGEP